MEENGEGRRLRYRDQLPALLATRPSHCLIGNIGYRQKPLRRSTLDTKNKEFVDNLEAEVGLANIDFMVQNHAEVDHSGALPELLRQRPDPPIYRAANAVKSLKGHYHQDWNLRVVWTGDSVDIGNGEKLVFAEAPMLHWPDTKKYAEWAAEYQEDQETIFYDSMGMEPESSPKASRRASRRLVPAPRSWRTTSPRPTRTT